MAVAPHKTEGPSTSIAFLGIVVDTERSELRLPSDKLSRLRSLVAEWKGKKSCCKRQLLSLIGQLQHACKVVRVGRTFLRRMSTVAKKLHHQIRLNKSFQSDLLWWDTFLEDWNGVSMLGGLRRGPPVATLTPDASGGWGCGAFTSGGDWFQLQWPDSWVSVHITVKELVPIVLAAAVWGPLWRGTVRCQCDNAAVVAIVRSGTSRHPLVMHLMRCLSFFVAYYQLYLDPVHLPGKYNEEADALSRDTLPVSAAQLRGERSSYPRPGVSDRQCGAGNSRLGVSNMDSRASYYFTQGLAGASIRTYQSGVNRFLRYCQSNNCVCAPVSEVVLCGFVSSLAEFLLRELAVIIYSHGFFSRSVVSYSISTGFIARTTSLVHQ